MSARFSGFKVLLYYSALFSFGIVKNMHFRDFFPVEWAGWTFFKVKNLNLWNSVLYVGIGENCKSHIKYFKDKYVYKLFM